jgi:predicted membrane protein
LGVAAAECIHMRYQKAQRIHWRQLVLAIEILLLFAVGFFPNEMDLLANAMVSFACAMQVQAFRKVNGYAFASTMCIGNLRSGMESLCAYGKTKDKKILRKSGNYFGIIFLFAVGAALGGHMIGYIGARTIWISCIILLISFLCMFIKEEKKEHPEIVQEEREIRENLQNIRKEAKDVEHILEDDIRSQIEKKK